MSGLGAELIAAWERGAEQFNSHRYWHAHEEWERGWVGLPSPVKDRVQGLIQACGVFVHLQKGRPGPALSLSRSALQKLSRAAEPGEMRIEIPGLEGVLTELIADLESDPDRVLKNWEENVHRLQARVVRAI